MSPATTLLALDHAKVETAEAENQHLRDVLNQAIADLRDTEAGEIPFHDSRTSLADWLAVQVQPRRQCPLLQLMAGERPLLLEAM